MHLRDQLRQTERKRERIWKNHTIKSPITAGRFPQEHATMNSLESMLNNAQHKKKQYFTPEKATFGKTPANKTR